ncbi:hypothetical protein OE88DRAFT_1655030 [Heliocybe sulcata]|uniref:Uncharacterized protein n=1 Tax=Heliocybe sulcata TaxID=5364 RepID=A0A5C3NEB5_9AGAM|nr:hypothetical protein OE88DRAFT_1655030 [Heliocybe sulcata]
MAALNAYPIRHPWLDMSKLKRKDMEDDPVYTSPPNKRRRWDTLEHGFEGLTIDALHPQGGAQLPSSRTQTQSYATSSAVSSSDNPYIQYPSTAPQPTLPSAHHFSEPSSLSYAVQPTSVEEPASPELADIKMKGASWYEPEKDRVVITDLDEFAEESDEEGDSLNNQGIEVASGYLAHINEFRDPFLPSNLGMPAQQPERNMALVLFRPLPSLDFPQITEVQYEDDTQNPAPSASSGMDDAIADDIVMDYEPMDVEP